MIKAGVYFIFNSNGWDDLDEKKHISRLGSVNIVQQLENRGL